MKADSGLLDRRAPTGFPLAFSFSWSCDLLSAFGEQVKEMFNRWRIKVLQAVLGVPDLVDAAEIIGHGEIQLIVSNGKIQYVNFVPKIKADATRASQ